MGCASSKISGATVDVYRPAPTSFAVFDINSIEEPWVKAAAQDDTTEQQDDEKPIAVRRPPILEKLNAIDDAPRSWDEVSKALEDLKPTLHDSPAPPKPNNQINVSKTKSLTFTPQEEDNSIPGLKKTPRKSFSFHTLEELDAKVTSKQPELRKTESLRDDPKKPIATRPEPKKFDLKKPEPKAAIIAEGYKPVQQNIFILRDREEREKEGKNPTFVKRDILSDFPEICPPGGTDKLVLYTTSLGGIRKTYEDCNKVRSIMEFHRVVFDERDVSLHGGFLNELKELMGEAVTVPRVFVKGRYIGGVEEVVDLNELGKLGRVLTRAGVERGVGRRECDGCGGARFVPCMECGGSCKILVGDENEKERCPDCNENGLVHCPACV